jgi:hypothetical protein
LTVRVARMNSAISEKSMSLALARVVSMVCVLLGVERSFPFRPRLRRF